MNTTPREYRNRFGKYALQRQHCQDCDRFDDYVAEVCYHCGSSNLETVDLTPEGEVLTFVVQYYLPEEFDTPLPLGLVETPEGARVVGMFTECDNPEAIDIGDLVDIVLKRFTRDDGRVIYEPKFRLIAEAGGDAR